jgi:hypothetical protein
MWVLALGLQEELELGMWVLALGLQEELDMCQLGQECHMSMMPSLDIDSQLILQPEIRWYFLGYNPHSYMKSHHILYLMEM